MRTVVICSLILFLAVTAAAQTNLSGTIAADSTLSRARSPYVVTGDVTVNSPRTLKIDSGVVVRFQSNVGLYIRGHLNARWVTFTSNKDTSGGNPQKGDWGGIQIGNSSYAGTAEFDTCQVKFSGSIQAAVYCYSGSISLFGCSISSSI